ncbi:Protein-tyrosine-phosphatase mkp1 [Mactra antiquata]
MDRIGDTILYVGDRDSAESLQRRNDAKITHIVTVENSPLKWIKEDDRYKYLYHQCLDMEFEDLLSHFEKFFTFIDDAASTPDGKVLIHCFAGMSRSVTITAAYLMYKEKISAKSALKKIAESRGRVRPNDGFLRQLHIFNQMGGEMDDYCPVYKTYKLKRLAENVQSGNMDVDKLDLASEVDKSKSENYYKCMKCRRPLFRTSSLLVHTMGVGEAAFDWRAWFPAGKSLTEEENNDDEDTVCDKSIFIEPVQWMAGILNQLEGKAKVMVCLTKCQTDRLSFTVSANLFKHNYERCSYKFD